MDNDIIGQGTEGPGIQPAPQPDNNSGNVVIGDAGQQASPQQYSQPTPAPAPQGNWNPDEWGLSYRGQTIKPKDRQHLINLAQQGLSYSQSMAALKQQQEEMQKRYQGYDQLDNLFRTNPAVAQRVAAVLQEMEQGTPQQQQQAAMQLPPEFLNEIQELKEFKTTFVQQQADQQLDAEIAKLKGDYADEQWDAPDPNGQGTLIYRVMKHAYDNKFPNLNSAYRDLMWDHRQTAIKADALKQGVANRQAQTKAGVLTGATPGQPSQRPQFTYNKSDSYNDLVGKAVAALGH
jgi:hypothetical protein